MIIYPQNIFLVCDNVDMRFGMNSLSLYLQKIGQVVNDGSAYLFMNARRNRLKVLIWDGNGVWLLQRRLHQGFFVKPKVNLSHIEITQAQWLWLISGVDWRRVDPKISCDFVC